MNAYRILFKKHKTGKVGFWHGWVEDDSLVVMEWAAGPNDSRQRSEERIYEGKQGRTIYQQAVFRLDSRTSNKIDAGYQRTEDEAARAEFVTDALGHAKPMLAQKFKDYKRPLDPNNTYVQLKYNGHRCLIFNDGKRHIAVSRNGKEIPGIPHILDNLDLEPGQIIDGEIYCHGWKLQTIASAAKRYQEASKQLSYVAYDMVNTELGFLNRYTVLSKHTPLADGVKVAPTIKLGNRSITELLEQSIQHNYEGLILRLDDVPYEIGRRSSSLLKVKALHDAEFQVIDIVASKDGWGILVCRIPDGGTFKVSAPGTISEKEKVLKNKDLYTGKQVMVEYSELTQDGVPFHPVALSFREDL